MTMDDSSVFPKMSFTHSHTTSHSNLHNDELHECPICIFQTLEILTVPDAFNHVLSTNGPPDDTLIASLCSSLASIRSLSANIEKHLAAMQHAKNVCALSIKKHEAAIHPIRSLPDDILFTIFRWHIHSETDKINGDTDSYLCLPWKLSQVSHRWRTLTLLSPSLWIAVNVRYYHHNDFRTLEDRWKLVIERSAQCDLVVSVDDGSAKYYNIPSLMESLRLLLWTTPRCRKFTIHARHSCLEPLARCSFQRLTELIWDLSCSDAPKTEFRGTVNLRRLTVSGSSPLDLKWDQITDYSCTPAGFQYLPKLTTMEHLALDFTESRGASPPILAAQVSLPSVRSMSMRQEGGGGQSLHKISQLLHFPSLNDLVIIFPEGGTLPSFREPLSNLRHLVILSNIPLGNISTFLASHDSVESLYIMNQYVMEFLRIIPGHPIILPNLMSLSIDAKMLVYDIATFLEVIESRCGDDKGHVVRLIELELVGTEWMRSQAMGILSDNILPVSKRWNTILQKITFVEKDILKY